MKTPTRCCAFALACVAALAPLRAGTVIDLPGIGGGSYRLPLESLKTLRFRGTVRQQYDFSCGSAALATLLTYHYDYPIGEQEVFAAMFAAGDQAKIRKEGFSLLDMKRFLAARGFVADGFERPLSDVGRLGFPAIVMVAEHGYQHFVVIKGMDAGRVLVGDPATGTRAMSMAAFEAVWPRHLLFVIHAGQGAVHFNRSADWTVAPRPWLGEGIDRASLSDITVRKNGDGNF